jgi:hypothetical protein
MSALEGIADELGEAEHVADGRCQSKILNTWSGHRTAQIDPENAGKSMATKSGSDVLAK